MSMLGINGALAGMYQLAASKGIVKTERADITPVISLTSHNLKIFAESS